MPKGPQGQWRPAATGACAAHVMKIATGELEETFEPPERAADPAAKRRASIGGKARAAALSPERRKEIARAGGQAKAAGAADA